MPPEQSDDYSALKKAMLKRYQLTQEGFRFMFRDSKPEQGETVFQFMARLVRDFSRWAEMAEVDGAFESLVGLIIREQFIQACLPGLAFFLKSEGRSLELRLLNMLNSTKNHMVAPSHLGDQISCATELTTNSLRGQLLARLPNHHKLIDQGGRNLCISYAERRDTLLETAGRTMKRR